jgi:hypothetical protein
MSGVSEGVKQSIHAITWWQAALLIALILASFSTGWLISMSQSASSNSASLQQSVSATLTPYSNFLQQLLDKLADVSHNKSLKIGSAQLDSMASTFRFAGSASSLFDQYPRLCLNQTSISNINQAGVKINNPNFTLSYSAACQTYFPALTGNYSQVNSNTMMNLSSDFTDLVFNLVKLDNAISQDP